MHRYSFFPNRSSSNNISTIKIVKKLLASVCALLILLLFIRSTSADGNFIYSAGDLEFARQQFPATKGQGFVVPFSADLNGDGATDIILTGATIPSQFDASRGPQPGLILFNNGDNTFTPAEGDKPASELARELVIKDYDGDGILDIYIADVGFDAQPFPGFKNQLLLGTGLGFTDVSDRLPDVEGFTHGAAAADIDGDGDFDIISLNTGNDDIEEISYFLLNDGNANFTMDRQRLPDSLSNIASIIPSFSAELSDLDNDGFADLIIGGNAFASSPLTRIHWNDGTGFFSDDDVTRLQDADPWGLGAELIAVVEVKGIDVNGDNLNDLLLHGTNQGTFTGLSLQLFINQGNRIFRDETFTRLTSLVQSANPNRNVPSSTQFIDMNGDGIIDILTAHSNDYTDDGMPFFEGTGDGCFIPITMGALTDDSNARGNIAGDPVVSPNAVGFIGAGIVPISDTEDVFDLGYVPLDIQPAAPIANRFNACRGKLEVNLEFSGDLYKLDFSIFSTEPDVVIQAITSSVRELTESMQNLATFNSADGKLVLPELVLDGEVAFRNLVFQLTDGERLLFRLDSFE